MNRQRNTPRGYSRAAGFNCFELALVGGWLACGAFGATYLRHRIGIIGVPVGFISGFGASFGGYWALITLVNWWVPDFPRCQCGFNPGNDYRFEEWLSNEEKKYWGSVYVCLACGRKYVKTRRRVQELLPDGSFKPYMVYDNRRRWRHEQMSN